VPRDHRGSGERLRARLRPAHRVPSSGGPGIRLDGGTAYPGAVITPFYDSLLVKVTRVGRRPRGRGDRADARCAEEFRIRGVKTNIPFLD
jgi:pyruvate carboxylase